MTRSEKQSIPQRIYEAIPPRPGFGEIRDIAQIARVSRWTAQRVLKDLADRGVIDRGRRTGTTKPVWTYQQKAA